MDSLKAMIEKLSSRLKEIWTGLNLNQKVLISGALLLIVTAVVVSDRKSVV